MLVALRAFIHLTARLKEAGNVTVLEFVFFGHSTAEWDG